MSRERVRGSFGVLSAVLGARAQSVDVPVDGAEVCPARIRPPPWAERLDTGLAQRLDRGIDVVDVERRNGTRHEVIVVGFGGPEDLELLGIRQLEPREVVAQLSDGQRDDVAEERRRLREPLCPHAGPHDPMYVHSGLRRLRLGVYLAGRRGWTVNPSFPSTLTAPVFPPSKSPEARRWPVANS